MKFEIPTSGKETVTKEKYIEYYQQFIDWLKRDIDLTEIRSKKKIDKLKERINKYQEKIDQANYTSK